MCYSNLKARWSKEMLAMFEGFVLQGLVTPLLSKVVHPNKNNIYMSQMHIIAQRGRIVATILPFFPFWDSFFSLSLQNTQWNDRKADSRHRLVFSVCTNIRRDTLQMT